MWSETVDSILQNASVDKQMDEFCKKFTSTSQQQDEGGAHIDKHLMDLVQKKLKEAK